MTKFMINNRTVDACKTDVNLLNFRIVENDDVIGMRRKLRSTFFRSEHPYCNFAVSPDALSSL